MSSLIFHTDEKQALVATDTLATSTNGQPVKFTTKAFALPNLRMILACTGLAGFLTRWLIAVNDNLVARGIDNVNYHAPAMLTQLWTRAQNELSLPASATTTVYHFGFSENTSRIHSYAYRSTNAFQSELLGYGIAVKPECAVPDEYVLPRDIKMLMDRQRTIQADRPIQERLFIGGEIVVYHLTERGLQTYTFERFDDYERDEQAIYRRFAQGEST